MKGRKKMQRKDLLEIKKRFKKNECTFTRMTGCYVNATKEKVTSFSNVFLNLPDEEYYKYFLELFNEYKKNARKVYGCMSDIASLEQRAGELYSNAHFDSEISSYE